jgi:hypothetical protein
MKSRKADLPSVENARVALVLVVLASSTMSAGLRLRRRSRFNSLTVVRSR